MAIVPKRKTSKQRKHKRRTHHALIPQNLVDCKNCSTKFNNTKFANSVAFIKKKSLKVTKVSTHVPNNNPVPL